MASGNREIIKLSDVKLTDDEADTVRLIPVSDIDDSGRLRPVDSAAAEGIAVSIGRHGLLSPIDICRMVNQSSGLPYRLVCGAHRLAAVRSLGWETIPAFVRSNNALERRSREIEENFFKAELGPLDKAAFVAELIETEKARLGIEPDKDGRALNADRRSQKYSKKQINDDLCSVHKSLGIQESVAARLGLTQATVSRQLALNGIAPSFMNRVRSLPIADNAGQLRALAKLHWAEQDDVIALIDKGEAKTVSDALAKKRKEPVRDKSADQVIKLHSQFSRLDARQKAEFLRLIQSQVPAGWSLSEEAK